jgi:hypothetical protein
MQVMGYAFRRVVCKPERTNEFEKIREAVVLAPIPHPVATSWSATLFSSLGQYKYFTMLKFSVINNLISRRGGSNSIA